MRHGDGQSSGTMMVEVCLLRLSQEQATELHEGRVLRDDDDRMLYPFKYFDPLRRRWVEARYKATKKVIAERYKEWEITGPGWTPPDIDRRPR